MPASTLDALRQGRDAFARQAWELAYAGLKAAEQHEALEPADLERLAVAAHLVGRDAESGEAWARAHQGFLRRGDARSATRCAYWITVPLLFQGEMAQGSGWISRAQRLLDDGGGDCVERGLLLVATGIRAVLVGDAAAAGACFGEAAELGKRFGDPDLAALARHGQGRALIQLGDVAGGTALLDEAMAAITADEVSPHFAGVVYCSVIEACHEIFDVRRAQEWTAALTRWCERRPDIRPYRGQCLIRRAELLQLHGAWPDAADEAARAHEWLSRPPPQRGIGGACYRLAEVHRLRGEFAEAEEAYGRALQAGHETQPGLALLRLAQGLTDAARPAIARARGGPVAAAPLPAAARLRGDHAGGR